MRPRRCGIARHDSRPRRMSLDHRYQSLPGPILVIGASGFVGANLLRRCLANRSDVIGTVFSGDLLALARRSGGESCLPEHPGPRQHSDGDPTRATQDGLRLFLLRRRHLRSAICRRLKPPTTPARSASWSRSRLSAWRPTFMPELHRNMDSMPPHHMNPIGLFPQQPLCREQGSRSPGHYLLRQGLWGAGRQSAHLLGLWALRGQLAADSDLV